MIINIKKEVTIDLTPYRQGKCTILCTRQKGKIFHNKPIIKQ
jgi:hypothetical protein